MTWLVILAKIVYAAQELKKSLGFQSNLQLQLSLQDKAPYMTPRIVVSSDDSNPASKLTHFEQLNAFDSLLHHKTSYVCNAARELLRFPPKPNIDITKFKTMIESSPKLLTAGKNIYSMAIKERLLYYRSNGNRNSITGFAAKVPSGVVSLKLSNGFSETLAEFNIMSIELYASDFLMSNGILGPGKCLAEEMARLYLSQLYGSKTLEIMESIGYSTVGKSNVPRFKLITSAEQQALGHTNNQISIGTKTQSSAVGTLRPELDCELFQKWNDSMNG